MSQAARYLKQGLSYFEQGNYQNAIENYTQAIYLDRHYLEAYLNRANVYVKLERLELAIEDYTRAIEIDPHIIAIYQHRGIAYSKNNQRYRAIADWQRAIELLRHQDDLDANTITSLSNSIATELAKDNRSTSWAGGIGQKLDGILNSDRTSTRELILTYRLDHADNKTINNPSHADLELVVDQLWQEARNARKREANSRFTGHFILEDRKTKDYLQGIWDSRCYPAGGFHLEWFCNGNRSWLPLLQTNSAAKEVVRLWLEDVRACSALNWELIDSDPLSLEHYSRRGFNVIYLLKQYEAGARNFRKEDLSNANLFETDLQGINLSYACLVDADLRGANLTGANLTEADLGGACLIEADLRGANLTRANLEGAIYDEDTKFPFGFDPETAEMEFYTYEAEVE